MIEIKLGSKNKEKKSKRQFSKTLTILVLATTFIISMYTLYLCKLCIQLNFSGSLPFLSALIGLAQGSCGYVLSKYFDKSKAENTKNGIVYENSLKNQTDDESI